MNIKIFVISIKDVSLRVENGVQAVHINFRQ